MAWLSTRPACTRSSGAARKSFSFTFSFIASNVAGSYACPICTMRDVGFDKDACDNGNRSVTAYWQPESK